MILGTVITTFNMILMMTVATSINVVNVECCIDTVYAIGVFSFALYSVPVHE